MYRKVFGGHHQSGRFCRFGHCNFCRIFLFIIFASSEKHMSLLPKNFAEISAFPPRASLALA